MGASSRSVEEGGGCAEPASGRDVESAKGVVPTATAAASGTSVSETGGSRKLDEAALESVAEESSVAAEASRVAVAETAGIAEEEDAASGEEDIAEESSAPLSSVRKEMDELNRQLAIKMLHGTRTLMERNHAKQVKNQPTMRQIKPPAGSQLARRSSLAQSPSRKQASARSGAGSPPSSSKSRASAEAGSKLRHVCAELIETERKYLSDMKLLQARCRPLALTPDASGTPHPAHPRRLTSRASSTPDSRRPSCRI